jgi:hypothetical protein
MPAGDAAKNRFFSANDGFSVNQGYVGVGADFNTQAATIALFLVDGDLAGFVGP